MKKVVRLTESDIVRLVKKVISENKKMINEAPQINIDWGNAYKGHTVQSLNVVTGGQPYLEFILRDGRRQKYKVDTRLGNVNFKNLWMNGGKLNVEFYSGGGGKTTTVEVPDNKTYDLFEKMKSFPQNFELVSDNVYEPNIRFTKA